MRDNAERRSGVAARIMGRWRAPHEDARPERAPAERPAAPPPRRRAVAPCPAPEPRPVARVGMVTVTADGDGLARLHDVLARPGVPRCVIVELRGTPQEPAVVRSVIATAPTRVVIVTGDHPTRAALAGLPGVQTTTSRTAAMQLASGSSLVAYRTLAA